MGDVRHLKPNKLTQRICNPASWLSKKKVKTNYIFAISRTYIYKGLSINELIVDSQVHRCYENTGYFVYCMNYYEVIIEEHNKGPGILTWKKPGLEYQNMKCFFFCFWKIWFWHFYCLEKSTKNMVSLIFLPIENRKISRNVLHAILCPRPFCWLFNPSLLPFTNYLDIIFDPSPLLDVDVIY